MLFHTQLFPGWKSHVAVFHPLYPTLWVFLWQPIGVCVILPNTILSHYVPFNLIFIFLSSILFVSVTWVLEPTQKWGEHLEPKTISLWGRLVGSPHCGPCRKVCQHFISLQK